MSEAPPFSLKTPDGRRLSVALVHDWLVTYRGGERVLEALCEMFPDAPIFTLFHQPGSQSTGIEKHRIIESPLGRIPLARARHRWFLPLFPWAIEQFDLSAYDVVISTSHAVAKGVITRADALHVSYVHTPMRYVWELAGDYERHAHPLVRMALKACAPYLRLWDESSERRVDVFVANSKTVAKRITKRYRRDSVVVNPPVDVERFHPSHAPAKDFYLAVSALVPYKRIDLLVEAFGGTSRRLKIVGDGPELSRLRAMASSNIEFLGPQSGEALAELYRDCQALLFPGEEDFGITPLEAMASGRPVIAYARGGATETVVPLVKSPQPDGEDARAPTGVWFHEQTVASLRQALDDFETAVLRFDSDVLRAHALVYRRERFQDQMRALIVREVERFFASVVPSGPALKGPALKEPAPKAISPAKMASTSRRVR